MTNDSADSLPMIRRIDHLVLTVGDIQASCCFYERVLGTQVVTFGEGRKSLHLGQQKINLHPVGREFEPKAQRPTAGSADRCFLCDTPLREIRKHIEKQRVDLIEGPVRRTGANGAIMSLYFRDADGNLIEVAVELTD